MSFKKLFLLLHRYALTPLNTYILSYHNPFNKSFTNLLIMITREVKVSKVMIKLDNSFGSAYHVVNATQEPLSNEAPINKPANVAIIFIIEVIKSSFYLNDRCCLTLTS